jgi:phosphoesterase RecJ-like protein
MAEENIGAIKECLDKSKNVVIASHIRPDGDAIGSLLGLGLALRDARKSVQMVLVDGVASSFRHLEGSERIVKEPTGEHDTFITVDAADFKRVGKAFENFGVPDINIDHHKTNENFGKLNLIEAEEVATAAILPDACLNGDIKLQNPLLLRC